MKYKHQCFYCWFGTNDFEELKLHKKTEHPKGVILKT